MKIKHFFFLLSIAIITSCNQNDGINLNAAGSSDLLGTWNVTAQRIENGMSETTVAGQTISSSFESYGKDFNFTYVFSESPNTVVAQGTYTSVNTTTIAGQTMTQEIPASSIDGLDSGTWIFGTDRITLTDNSAYTSVGYIEEFTSTKLTLRFDVDETIDQGGIISRTSGTMYLTMEK